MIARRIPYPVLIGALLGLILVLGVGSLAAGRVWVPLPAWFAHGDPRSVIVFGLRAPRALLGILVGAALGLSGAALQGYTRNPLADPGLLGISAMAALGAVLSLYFGLAVATAWLLPSAAVVGAVVGIGILIVLAGRTGGVITFVLAGVILQTLAGAGVALALSLAPNPWASGEIVNWLLGSLQDRSLQEVQWAAPFVLVGGVLIFLTAPALDALTLGEVGARALGVNLGRTQWLLALGVGLATGGCVAVTGEIGFVGLIVPHLIRPLVGGRPGRLLLPSALAGAALILAADILVRLTPAAQELKLGVAMTAIGAPFFLTLLLSMRRRLA
jgi:iron complex transport system permease protein